jgi:5-methylcytosine-specific restriction endonuclease McrA
LTDDQRRDREEAKLIRRRSNWLWLAALRTRVITKKRQTFTPEQRARNRLISRKLYEDRHPGCLPYLPGVRGKRRLPDDVREERKRLRKLALLDRAYEARIRRQRIQWVFQMTAIPGCRDPRRCKLCGLWFRPEDVRADRKCRACHRRTLKASRRRHPERHKERQKLAKSRRRARLKGAAGALSAGFWERVLVAGDRKCAHCSSPDNLTADHIVPLSKGGVNAEWNLQPLCHMCNSLKGASLTGATINVQTRLFAS